MSHGTMTTRIAEKSTSPRRWFQFGLRTMIVLVLVASLPCAWVAHRLQHKRHERAAVAALRASGINGKSGVTVWYHSQHSSVGHPLGPKRLRTILGDDFLDSVTAVRFDGDPADGDADSLFANLRYLNDIQELEVHSLCVSDEAMQPIPMLKKLSKLTLGQTRVTDKGVKELARLSNLTNLHISGGRLTDAGINQLTTLQALTCLEIPGAEITDAALSDIAKLGGLEVLNLRNCVFVTDRGVVEIARLRRLNHLDISGTQVADGSLGEIAGLEDLEYLYLDGAGITDQGVMELVTLRGLKILSITGTRVTETSVSDLQKALPALQVFN